MKANEIITESLSTSLLIIDVQPTHRKYSDSLFKNGLADRINKHNGPINFMFNGKGYTYDTKDDIIMYLYNHNVDVDKLSSINFIEKVYAYFRNWMDNNVHDRAIIKTIRYLINNKIRDSKFIEDLKTLLGDDYQDHMEDNSIYLPDDFSIKLLKDMSPFYMAGGSRTRCLREIELLCNALNIKFKRMDDFIY